MKQKYRRYTKEYMEHMQKTTKIDPVISNSSIKYVMWLNRLLNHQRRRNPNGTFSYKAKAEKYEVL